MLRRKQGQAGGVDGAPKHMKSCATTKRCDSEGLCGGVGALWRNRRCVGALMGSR